jgi:hypothetical protein
VLVMRAITTKLQHSILPLTTACYVQILNVGLAILMEIAFLA